MKDAQTDLVVAEKPAMLAPVSVNLEALLNKAVDAKSAVEVIKELRLMELDMQARSAKAAFDEAMSAFQEECPIITKDKAVPDRTGKTAYKYAPIECIEVQIRPLLRKYGFSHTFDTDTASAPGWVIAICRVKHKAGHSENSVAKFPLGTKTPLMSDTQVFAAALTFANRRALSNAYGLILAGEDMDGRTGKVKPQGPSTVAADVGVRELAKALWNLLKPVRGNDKDWAGAKQWLVDENIVTPEEHGGDVYALNVSPERYGEIIEAVKRKL